MILVLAIGALVYVLCVAWAMGVLEAAGKLTEGTRILFALASFTFGLGLVAIYSATT